MTADKATQKEILWAYLAIGSTILAAAGAPIFIRYGQLEGVPSLYIVALRFWLTFFMMVPFIRGAYWAEVPTLNRREWGWLVLGGFVLAVNISSLFFALEYTSVLVTGVLRRTSPLWVIGLEIAFFGIVFHRRVWGGLGLTVVGSMFVALAGAGAIEGGTQPVLGAMIALFNAVAGGAYFLIGRVMRHRLPAFTYSWLIFGFGAVFTTVAVLVMGIPLWGYSMMGYVWVFVVTIVAQVFGHIPINIALHYFPATYLSISLQLSVVLGAIFAFFMLGQVPSGGQLVGSFLIIIGVLIVTLRGQDE